VLFFSVHYEADRTIDYQAPTNTCSGFFGKTRYNINPFFFFYCAQVHIKSAPYSLIIYGLTLVTDK
jgi:hypothetical protein